MKLISNAAPDELNSPFYIENEKISKEWEAYILDKGGKIIGNYNAWSYSIKCKITEPQPG